MPDHNKKFTYSILVPTLLAIAMFIVAFYAVIIPLFERSMMDRKQEMIIELTNTAWSVLAEYNAAYESGTLSLVEAKLRAAEHIGKMRYGSEQKDYFWIISSSPRMIMHPYRSDLIGSDLSNFRDAHGNKLFDDAAKLVKEQGEGVIEYYWQWKDDETRIVPKLSYVQGFEEWDWIIGTGIYLEDVEAEIRQLERDLFKVSSIIILIIALILTYVLRQTQLIEKKRKAAEEQLRLSAQKYKSLVEASSEGTLMVTDAKISYANSKFLGLFQLDEGELIGTGFDSLFEKSWEDVEARLNDPSHTYSFETVLRCGRQQQHNVVVSVSSVKNSGQLAYILLIKKATEQKLLRLDAEKLSEDVALSLQLMNQPVVNLLRPNIYCRLGDSARKAAELMTASRRKIICVKDGDQVIGVVTDTDLRSRVIAGEGDADTTVAAIMTSPIKSINKDALLHEAVLKFKQESISHLLVANEVGVIVGHISNQECLEVQRNSLSYLLQEISECTVIEDLRRIYNRVPVLAQAIFTSTDNISSVSRIITTIADAICFRCIELVMAEVGEPPCAFAFVVMGSQGRGEQALKTDQDNAIIFAEDSDQVQDYFLRLGMMVNELLHAIGYSRCNGDLMAGNPEWCLPLNGWQDLFRHWIESQDPKNVLDSSIFFDTRLVYGDQLLVDRLFYSVQDNLKENSGFFNQLARTVIQQKPVLDKKQVDIKQFLVPIIGYLRVLALRYGINETNSLLRLRYLVGYGIVSSEEAQEIEEMYKFLMHLRIKWQVTLIMDNDQPQNHVRESNLTAIEKVTLENIQQQVSKLQDRLKSAYRETEVQVS